MRPYYQDEFVTLYHGDCREVGEWRSAYSMVTDPPYGMDYKSGWSGADIANDATTRVRDEMLKLWGADQAALVFGRWSCPRPAATRHVLIWDKGDWPGMGDLTLPWGPSTEEVYVIGTGFVGKRRGSILRDPKRPSGGTAWHPTEKPIGLMEMLVQSTLGIVADPFSGSGSTLIAAKNLGRKAIGVEVEERYCEIAAKRLAQGVLWGVA